MIGNIIEVEQIHNDTVLIIVRGDFTRFTSLEFAKAFRERLEQVACKTGKPVMILEDSFKIEQLDDSRLAALGLQRIKN